MTLIIENGKVVNVTDKSIDSLKRAQYGHDNITEDTDELESFVDNLEPIEDGEDSPPEADFNPDAVEVALQFAQFKSAFVSMFGEEDLSEAFLQFEDFFSQKGVDVTLDLEGLGQTEEGITDSEPEIISSEIVEGE